MTPDLNTSAWARLGASNQAHICPECEEDAIPAHPRDDGVPYSALGLPAPTWSHRDGTPLCPVVGASGYQPADPVAKPHPGKPRYTAGWNQPGYLPDPDGVAEFDVLDDARTYLVGELDYAFELHDGDERASAIEAINALTGPDTVYAGGWAWWIHQDPTA